MKSRAFTLIELLVVVLIIGILSAIALPQYQKAVAKARLMEFVIAAKAIADAQNVYYMANNEYSTSTDQLSLMYPAQSDNVFKIGKGTCTLAYSSVGGGNERVSCDMLSPRIVLQLHYKSYKRTCCTYSSDNYAGDGVCANLLNTKTWTNGCSEEYPCHCYWE